MFSLELEGPEKNHVARPGKHYDRRRGPVGGKEQRETHFALEDPTVASLETLRTLRQYLELVEEPAGIRLYSAPVSTMKAVMIWR